MRHPRKASARDSACFSVRGPIGMFVLLLVVFIMISSSAVISQDAPAPSSAAPAAGAAPAAQPAVAAAPSGSSYAGPAQESFPQCSGGDMQKLAELNTYSKCYRFVDKFDSYAKQSGYYDLGADLLFLFVMAKGESGCDSRFVDDPGEIGGIFQTIGKCTADPATNKCNSVDDEIRFGIEHFTQDIKAMFDKGVYGRQAFWLSSFGYNRGRNAAMKAADMVAQGMTVQQAADKACTDVYMNRQQTFRETYSCATKFTNIPEKYGCSGKSSDSMCSNGKECSLNAFCDVKYEDVGIHYADKKWHDYLDVCAKIGGTVSDAALPALPGQAGMVTPSAAGVAVRQVISHPYFDVPYSIDPSFSVGLPFNLSIYDYVPAKVKSLERCRNDLECILANVSIIELENPDLDWLVKYAGNVISVDQSGQDEDLKWLAYCESQDVFAVNSMAEALDAAKSSSGADCVVDYSIPAVDTSFLASMASFFISASTEILGIRNFGLGELLIDWGTSKNLVFSKSGDGVRVLLDGGSAPVQVVKGARFSGISSSVMGSSHDRIHLEVAGPLRIFKDEKGNLSVYSREGAPSSDACEVNNKVVKFCVLQNKSVFVYDESLNRFGVYRLAFKFAYIFGSQVTDVKGFEVRDAKYASGKYLISWSEVEGVDVDHYTIYYSENPGVAAAVKTLSPAAARADAESLPDVVAVDLPQVAEREALLSFDLDQEPICVVGDFDPAICAVRYGVPTETSAEDLEVELFDNTQYYSMNEKKYFYLLPGLVDGQRYFFAITATDVNGQESPSFTVVEDAAYEVSENDLVPGLARIGSVAVSEAGVVARIDLPDYAIDGSYLDPNTVNHFRIFCSASQSDIDLLSAPSFFESGFTTIEDGSVELMADLSNFNAASCGAEPPMDVYLVIAPVQKQGVEELYYKGTATSMSFSPVVSIPAPAP